MPNNNILGANSTIPQVGSTWQFVLGEPNQKFLFVFLRGITFKGKQKLPQFAHLRVSL